MILGVEVTTCEDQWYSGVPRYLISTLYINILTIKSGVSLFAGDRPEASERRP